MAHSVGCCVALEVASNLEGLGFVGTISFIDGSPAFIKELSAKTRGADWESAMLCGVLSFQLDEPQIIDFAVGAITAGFHCFTYDRFCKQQSNRTVLSPHDY